MTEGDMVPERERLDPASVPTKLYANGFVASFTASDFYIIGQLNGLPVFTLNLSFTSTKSLATLLDQLMKDFEKRSKMEVHTMTEIGTNLNDSYSKNQE